MEITSLTNAKVKQWVKYKEKKHREQDRVFMIEGEHLLKEAYQAGLIDCILVEQGKEPLYYEFPIYVVTKEILKKLSNSVSGTWIMALCHYPEEQHIVGDKVVLLDGVQDPGNVGTILRTALSFSYDTVVLSNQSVDLYNDKVIRSTQGALFHLHVVRRDLKETIQELKEKGYTIYGTSLHEAKPLAEISSCERYALIMGNEGQGVSQEVLDLCDQNIYIEMDTFESLNVAVAAGICMYTLNQK